MKKSSISYVYSIKNKINISPEYQRQGDLWNLEKKQLFLDSILTNFDIPKLYLHILTKPYTLQKNKILYAVIDGRQRLETLWSFIENEFPLGELQIEYRKKTIDLTGLTYQDMAERYPTLVELFDDYSLPLIGVKTIDDDQDPIEDMFSRLNEAVSINAPEKRNAIGGKLVKLIREIALHDFFTNAVTIPNKRYQHYEVVVRLLYLEYCIRNGEINDTKKSNLDQFAKDYKNKSLDSKISDTVDSALSSMTHIFDTNDKLLGSQARIPIYYLLFREGKMQNILKNITREKIFSFVKKVEKNKENGKISIRLTKQDLTEYDRLTIQGTNDASSIRTRFHIIARHLGVDSSKIDNL